MATISSLTADLRLESAAFIRDLGKAARATEANTSAMRKSFDGVARSTSSAARTLQGLFTVQVAKMVIRQLQQLTRASLDAAAAIEGPLGDSVRQFQAENERMTQAFQVGFGVGYVEAFNAELAKTGTSLRDIVQAGYIMGHAVATAFVNLINLTNDLYRGWARFKSLVTLQGMPSPLNESNPLTFGEYSIGDAALVDQITAALNNMTPALQSNAAAVGDWKTKVAQDTTEATAAVLMFSDQWMGSLQSTLGGISAFSGALAEEQEAWFRVNQAVSIAQALIATYTGAAEALKLGPVIGPALAAFQVATGLAYVAQIAAQKPGTAAGGAVRSSNAGVSKASKSGQNSGSAGGRGSVPQAITINARGRSRWTDMEVRDLTKRISEVSKDGPTTVVYR